MGCQNRIKKPLTKKKQRNRQKNYGTKEKIKIKL